MAKEKFENRTLFGKVNVTCKFEDGTIRIWDTRKEEVVQHIIDIVDEYETDGYVLTLRQLHYQLVKSNWIVNHDSAYKKLGNILDDCKYSGIIDWDNIEDRGRKPYIPYYVKDVEDALNDTISQYRIDRQKGQDVCVELWTEKDALSAILRRSTEKYHIQLVVNKGYTSSSAIYNAYQRCVSKIRQGKKVTILYFGDHDPSGLDMIRDIRERLELMLRNGKHYEDLFYNNEIYECFEVLPIGLTMEQIKKYDLPPNPTKLTDSRANKYIKRFGKTCWEVDALNPKTLTSIVETNIKNTINLNQYEEMLKEEKAGLQELSDFINNRKK
jgi:hypothetical protein